MTSARRLRGLFLLLAAISVAVGLPAIAQTDAPDEPKRVISIVEVAGAIDAAWADYVLDEIDRANREGDLAVILQLSSNGVIKTDLERLLTAVRDSKVPIAGWVAKRDDRAAAVSGGVRLLWQETQLRLLRSNSELRPSYPVQPGGRDRYVPRTPRALLETETVSGSRAIDAGLAHAIAESLPGVMKALRAEPLSLAFDAEGSDVSIRFANPNLWQRVRHSVNTNPTLVYLLLLAGAGAVVFEMFQPGFGPAGYAGVILWAFAAIGLVGLPIAPWALALLLLGLAAMTWDIARGGLGLPTWGGAVALTVGSLFLVHSEGPALRVPRTVVAGGVLLSLLFFGIVMTIAIRALRGPGAELGPAMLGRTGEVRSTLNPQGHVLVEGALWRARVAEGSVESGTRVLVTGFDEEALILDVAPAEVASVEGE